jgi:hypothetical protein
MSLLTSCKHAASAGGHDPRHRSARHRPIRHGERWYTVARTSSTPRSHDRRSGTREPPPRRGFSWSGRRDSNPRPSPWQGSARTATATGSAPGQRTPDGRRSLGFAQSSAQFGLISGSVPSRTASYHCEALRRTSPLAPMSGPVDGTLGRRPESGVTDREHHRDQLGWRARDHVGDVAKIKVTRAQRVSVSLIGEREKVGIVRISRHRWNINRIRCRLGQQHDVVTEPIELLTACANRGTCP